MASKKVLGRGLGAFFPEYDEGEGEQAQEGQEANKDSEGSPYVEPQKRVNIVRAGRKYSSESSSAPNRV